jgi:hypothetical protein
MRCATFQDGSNWSILEGACEPRSMPSSVKTEKSLTVIEELKEGQLMQK